MSLHRQNSSTKPKSCLLVPCNRTMEEEFLCSLRTALSIINSFVTRIPGNNVRMLSTIAFCLHVIAQDVVLKIKSKACFSVAQ